MTADQDWQRLLEGLRTGDQQVVRDFYNRYGQWLHDIAGKHLASPLRRRFDAEDVVQSALRTFFRRAETGQFQFDDNERLWSLLCAITLTKVRENAITSAAERSVQREAQPVERPDDGSVRGGSPPRACLRRTRRNLPTCSAPVGLPRRGGAPGPGAETPGPYQRRGGRCPGDFGTHRAPHRQAGSGPAAKGPGRRLRRDDAINTSPKRQRARLAGASGW